MRCLVALVLLLLTPVGVFAADASTDDEEQIRQLIQRYVDIRNHMDSARLRELFTPAADQLVSTGQWRRGLDSVIDGAVASSRKETGTSSVTIESVRLLASDTAIADGQYQTASPGASAPRKMWSTFVLQRTRSGWRIAAIRNMLPAPAIP